MLEGRIKFIYHKEFWFVSAILNTREVDIQAKVKDLESFLLERINRIKEEDLKDIFRYIENFSDAEEKKKIIKEMVKSIDIKCYWHPFIHYFIYRDENTNLIYDTLGYFQFEVEYFGKDPIKKENLSADLIQQIPIKVNKWLEEFNKRKENQSLALDTESPIYVFVISKKTSPHEIPWTQEQINNHKEILGKWIEIYSGQWEDYTEKIFSMRIQNNLSNRLSELHFVHRNSGFIYMSPENYDKFFEGYMMKNVLFPTAIVRAIQFALMTINKSLEIFFKYQRFYQFMGLEQLERKIEDLRNLRGTIQTELSQLIYNELDWNKRQHYTRVLTHLLSEFNLESRFERLDNKFKLIQDHMEILYNKKSEGQQKKTRVLLTGVSILLGLGILADITSLITIAYRFEEQSCRILNSIILYLIIGVAIGIGIYILYIWQKIKISKVGKTVDALITDPKGNIIVIKRKNPPFQGKYALPGGFIEKNESRKKALLREVKEETNLEIKIDRKIGKYDTQGRDPRGNIISHAYKCHIRSDSPKMKSGDDASEIMALSLKEIENIELAFDHKKMIQDAGLLK